MLATLFIRTIPPVSVIGMVSFAMLTLEVTIAMQLWQSRSLSPPPLRALLQPPGPTGYQLANGWRVDFNTQFYRGRRRAFVLFH